MTWRLFLPYGNRCWLSGQLPLRTKVSGSRWMSETGLPVNSAMDRSRNGAFSPPRSCGHAMGGTKFHN